MRVCVISGQSGIGKDTVISYLYEFKRFPSLTTRPIRKGEIDGVNYHFVSRQEFLNEKKHGRLLDCVNISGYLYGFPIEDFLEQEGNYALNLVVYSGLAVRRLIYQAKLFYLTFPDKNTQIERLKKRGMSDYEIGVRLRDDPNEDKAPSFYDREIVNHNSFQTAMQIAKEMRYDTPSYPRIGKKRFDGRRLPIFRGNQDCDWDG